MYDDQANALLALALMAHENGTLTPHALAALRRLSLSYYDYPQLEVLKDWLTTELNPGEAWADAFLARLDTLTPEQRRPWPALLVYARSATAGKPTAKWLKQAEYHLAAVSGASLREVLRAALPLVPKARTYTVDRGSTAITPISRSTNSMPCPSRGCSGSFPWWPTTRVH